MHTDNAGEADAFDSRIRDRVAQGFSPDLRNAEKVPWFYNNPWRHPELAQMVFGEYLSFALSHLPAKPAKVLEVGCGAGHLSLELARNGYAVTGVDISPVSIDVARSTATRAEAIEQLGALDYHAIDFFAWNPAKEFDAVCFFLSLHHFGDLDSVLDHAAGLLRPGGRIVVVEPARDWFSQLDGAVAVLIRLLLAATGAWHTSIELPLSEAALDDLVQDAVREYQEARDATEAEQSPHDNDSAASEMYDALTARFDSLASSGGFAVVPRIVGGVRGGTDEKSVELARFIKVFDDYCTRRGLLQPGVMYFAGSLKQER